MGINGHGHGTRNEDGDGKSGMIEMTAGLSTELNGNKGNVNADAAGTAIPEAPANGAKLATPSPHDENADGFAITPTPNSPSTVANSGIAAQAGSGDRAEFGDLGTPIITVEGQEEFKKRSTWRMSAILVALFVSFDGSDISLFPTLFLFLSIEGRSHIENEISS